MSLTEVMFKEHQKIDLLFSTFYDSFKYETRYEIEIIVLSTNHLLISSGNNGARVHVHFSCIKTHYSYKNVYGVIIENQFLTH